jgi:hypothetical protein
MSNAVYPVPRFRPRPQPRAGGLWLRLRVWRHRVELDEQLAAGVHPVPGTLLHVRAEQLRSRRERGRLAGVLGEKLREAQKPTPLVKTGLPLRRRELRACRADVIALIRRLEDERPIDVQGAAMVNLLLFDGVGPLYRRGNYSLRFMVRSARLALDPPGRAPGRAGESAVVDRAP